MRWFLAALYVATATFIMGMLHASSHDAPSMQSPQDDAPTRLQPDAVDRDTKSKQYNRSAFIGLQFFTLVAQTYPEIAIAIAIRQNYTADELKQLADAAGLPRILEAYEYMRNEEKVALVSCYMANNSQSELDAIKDMYPYDTVTELCLSSFSCFKLGPKIAHILARLHAESQKYTHVNIFDKVLAKLQFLPTPYWPGGYARYPKFEKFYILESDILKSLANRKTSQFVLYWLVILLRCNNMSVISIIKSQHVCLDDIALVVNQALQPFDTRCYYKSLPIETLFQYGNHAIDTVITMLASAKNGNQLVSRVIANMDDHKEYVSLLWLLSQEQYHLVPLLDKGDANYEKFYSVLGHASMPLSNKANFFSFSMLMIWYGTDLHISHIAVMKYMMSNMDCKILELIELCIDTAMGWTLFSRTILQLFKQPSILLVLTMHVFSVRNISSSISSNVFFEKSAPDILSDIELSNFSKYVENQYYLFFDPGCSLIRIYENIAEFIRTYKVDLKWVCEVAKTLKLETFLWNIFYPDIATVLPDFRTPKQASLADALTISDAMHMVIDPEEH